MAIATDEAWRPLTASGDVRVLKYSWGPANANALAVRLGAHGWLVVSPPRGAPAAVQDELAADGGQKSPDLLLRVVSSTGEVVWWLGDLFSNTTAADQIWPLRVLSRLAGSGPGYRRNARPELVYVRDRDAWLSSVRSVVTAQPPTVVVPAHGDPVVADAAERTAAIMGG